MVRSTQKGKLLRPSGRSKVAACKVTQQVAGMELSIIGIIGQKETSEESN